MHFISLDILGKVAKKMMGFMLINGLKRKMNFKQTWETNKSNIKIYTVCYVWYVRISE